MPRKQNGCYSFKDFPEFRPNLSPRDIFKLGSFGGTYWRPIASKVTGKNYKNAHKKYPKTWWQGIPEEHLSSSVYDKNINRYKVKVGTSLEFWESKQWINSRNPYGWVQWYCDFFNGKRGPDDVRQINRWVRTAGPNSRFRRALINQLKAKRRPASDESVSPRIRQTLQHWAVVHN